MWEVVTKTELSRPLAGNVPYKPILSIIIHGAHEIFFKEKQYSSLSESDILVFRVLIDDDYLDVSTYSKILKLLDELIDIIYQILYFNHLFLQYQWKIIFDK